MTNANANHQDMVTDPSQNPQTKMDFSDDCVTVMNDSDGQMPLSIALDEQTPDMVRRGMLSQALLTSIRSRWSAIGRIHCGSDMNPKVANIIDDTLAKAVMVINTVANVGSLGSGN